MEYMDKLFPFSPFIQPPIYLQRNGVFFVFISGIFLSSFFSHFTPMAHAADGGTVFLIQNKWGGIHGISLDAAQKPSSPAMVRPNMDTLQYPMIIDLDAFPNGGYQLTAMGTIIPIGNTRLPYAAWAPIRDATAFVMLPDDGGGWISAGNSIKTIGRPPILSLPVLDRKTTIADLEYDPQRKRLAILSRDGKITICEEEKSRSIGSIPLKKDSAIDLEFSPEGFWILTERGKVFSWKQDKVEELSHIPDLGKGLACDLEAALNGTGFYILDLFGVIHACAGAAQVPTEPLTKPVAVDLEIVPGDLLPQWNPPGLHTRMGWGTESILLDPQGPSKPVSLIVDRAENMTVIWTQIRFDPQYILLDPNSVRVGEWWDQGLRDARINPIVDLQKGIMTLQGSGVHFPYEGASGSGEFARFAVASVAGVTEATTVLQVVEFYYRDAYQGNIDHTCPIINSCTVSIAPIQPILDLSWAQSGEWLSNSHRIVKSGEIIQADIRVESGSRMNSFEFGIQFTPHSLVFLGMTPGSVWRPDVPIQTVFDIPSRANEKGILEGQKIETQQVGACLDEKGSIVSLFFSVVSLEPGEFRLTGFSGKDLKGNRLNIHSGTQVLTISGE